MYISDGDDSYLNFLPAGRKKDTASTIPPPIELQPKVNILKQIN